MGNYLIDLCGGNEELAFTLFLILILLILGFMKGF